MNPILVCEVLIDLGCVSVIGVRSASDGPARIHIETRRLRPEYLVCETLAVVEDRPAVELADLPVFGQPARQVRWKHRWARPDPPCLAGLWTEQEPRITVAHLALRDRARRWVTFQIYKRGRTVNEVAQDLCCDRHAVSNAVIAVGYELQFSSPKTRRGQRTIPLDHATLRSPARQLRPGT